MAKRSGLSKSTIGRIWWKFDLKPHTADSFKLSSDPLFIEKIIDVIGLYHDPREKAVVLCVDENRPDPPPPPGIPQVPEEDRQNVPAVLDIHVICDKPATGRRGRPLPIAREVQPTCNAEARDQGGDDQPPFRLMGGRIRESRARGAVRR